MTPLEIAVAWSAQVPLAAALKMTGWLLAKGLLVPGLAGLNEPRAAAP